MYVGLKDGAQMCFDFCFEISLALLFLTLRDSFFFFSLFFIFLLFLSTCLFLRTKVWVNVNGK